MGLEFMAKEVDLDTRREKSVKGALIDSHTRDRTQSGDQALLSLRQKQAH